MSAVNELLLYERAMPAAPDNVVTLRQELRIALTDLGVSAARRSDIELVMTEAAGNAVLHAYPPQLPGLLFVDAGMTGRTLLLRVCDCGRGMTPRTDSPGLGIGLSLMSRLSDGLEIAPNRTVAGTCVAAVFRNVAPTYALARGRFHRRDAVTTREYLRALRTATQALRSDSAALIAEAAQAVDQSQRLRAERAGS